MAPGPGSRLDQYELLAVLGTGGMGEVYKARDLRLDRFVAVKVITSARDLDPESRARFDREARSLAALSHPNICQIFHYGDADGTPFLVMEYLEGETLAERLKDRGALTLDEVLRDGAQLASALEVAHRAGIVHRDLKPDNIMLTPGGLKLLDLGIAKRVASAADAPAGGTTRATLTALGVISGTLTYMAPEQMEGKSADARSDIFSFGAVLYEMATGRRAFHGSSQAAIIASIMTGQPPRASSLNAAVPAGLDALLEKCLEKNPTNRFQHAADLREAVRAVGSRSVVESTPPDREPAVAGKRKRRRIVISFSISISFLLLLAAFIVRQTRLPAEEVATQAAATPTAPPAGSSAPVAQLHSTPPSSSVQASSSVPPSVASPKPAPQLAGAPANRPSVAATPRPGGDGSLPAAGPMATLPPPPAQGGASAAAFPPLPTPAAPAAPSGPTGLAAGPAGAGTEKPPAATITPEEHAKREIEQLVRSYCGAMETLQPDQLKKLYPQVNVALHRELFRQYRSLKCTLTGPLEFDRLDASPTGGAQFKVAMRQEIQMQSGGAPGVVETIATFIVSRMSNRSPWLIDRLQVTPKPK